MLIEYDEAIPLGSVGHSLARAVVPRADKRHNNLTRCFIDLTAQSGPPCRRATIFLKLLL